MWLFGNQLAVQKKNSIYSKIFNYLWKKKNQNDLCSLSTDCASRGRKCKNKTPEEFGVCPSRKHALVALWNPQVRQSRQSSTPAFLLWQRERSQNSENLPKRDKEPLQILRQEDRESQLWSWLNPKHTFCHYHHHHQTCLVLLLLGELTLLSVPSPNLDFI